ncbi:ATP-binding cassette domain-containing protein [uncultured Paludibaculum sp.]|uniref:ABC transporter ATP-binding protein n=1 Tax=uncultured Paludibaculum sp. TaxID=1765020 RepID=UPI002AAAA790|nr:ATP-binding cassette domain-containing protein [uncultured Paludibaculum sp.]
MDAVSIESVTKDFGAVTAVDNLSLVVPEQTIHGFVGPNGSGKTTTMRMIVNIFYPDRGTIHVFGRQMRGPSSELIGYLPEERGLYRKMAVLPLLEFYGELRSERKVTHEVKSWLERLGLAHCASQPLGTLSKGMAQKVQLIAAIVPQPKMLILDEPFSGLDPVSADEVRAAILDLRKRGTTIILSTHDMGVAELMCDRVFMILKGKKVLDGTLDSIQEMYGSDIVRLSANVDSGLLRSLRGVEAVNDLGQVKEIRMAPGSDPQAILHAAISHGEVKSFAVARPSLHDIFVRIATAKSEAEVQVA